MVYIDQIIILNFFIDYILLLTTAYILKIKYKKRRLFLSALIGELSILYLFFNFTNLQLIIFKILLGILIIRIAFEYYNLKNFISNLIYFYLVSFVLGGTLYYFKLENIMKYNYILLLIPFFMNIFKKIVYNLKVVISTKYKVTIYLKNGKQLRLNGFMDTGNNLIDPFSSCSVIIINKDVDELFYFIPYKTIDKSSLIKCFKPRKVYIDGMGEVSNIVVGIVKNKFNGYDCLLNYNIMEGKC